MRRTLPWWAIGLAWLAWGLFNASRHRVIIPGVDWPTALQYAVPDALIWAALTPLVVWLARRLPIRRGAVLRPLALHVTVAVAVALVHPLVDASIHALVGWLTVRPSDLPFLYGKLLSHGFHSNVLIYGVLVGLVHYFGHLDRLRDRERQTAELRASLSEARLDSLRKQLRPHFLFNALNTISGLLEREPATARRLVRRLGDLLRMSLRSDGAHEVSLRDELAFVEAYLDIEQARFRDRLSARIDADEDALDCAVPAFVLQPIVENAVRHGVGAREAGGRIDISARCGNGEVELQVRDDGPGLGAPSVTSHGIGLANTRARLEALYGAKYRFDLTEPPRGGLTVTIGLPRKRAESVR